MDDTFRKAHFFLYLKEDGVDLYDISVSCDSIHFIQSDKCTLKVKFLATETVLDWVMKKKVGDKVTLQYNLYNVYGTTKYIPVDGDATITGIIKSKELLSEDIKIGDGDPNYTVRTDDKGNLLYVTLEFECPNCEWKKESK